MKRIFVCLVAAALISISGCAGNHPGGAENVQTPASSEWNPNSWTSDIEIPPKFTTEEEKFAFRDRWLRRNAESMGLSDPPDIPLVAWQNVSQERNEKLAECYRLKGFSAYAPPQGGVLFDPGVPEAQNESFNLATHECYSKYFLDPEFLANLTED